MRLNLLAKDPGSDIGGCPAVYDFVDAPADPECVVQGEVITNDHLENVLPGEGAVRIKRSILIDAMRRYTDSS